MKTLFTFIFLAICSFSNLKAQYGSGADGNVTISGSNVIINTYFAVDSANGTTIKLASGTVSANKKYLLCQADGANAGNWEIANVGAVTGITCTLTVALTYSFGGGAMQLIDFPQYDTLRIDTGNSITCPIYDYSTGLGGVLFFMAKNKLTLNGGVIDVSGKGFTSNRGGLGAPGGAGGIGGLGGLTGGHGNSVSVPNTGIGGGGNGGNNMANRVNGNASIIPTFPGCGLVASNSSIPVSIPAHPSLFMGACGYSGNGGMSGSGAGGGGGGAGDTLCNNGQVGGDGGGGGSGTRGGYGGGVIIIFAKTTSYTGTNLLLAKGNSAIKALNGLTGGNGGNGASGCGTCTTGGGGGGGTGGDGGNGGNGGSGAAGGFIYIKKVSGDALTSSIFKASGGLGAAGGSGDSGGIRGSNAPLLSGAGISCPTSGGTGSASSGGGGGLDTPAICTENVALDLFEYIGTKAYSVINPSTGVYIYFFGSDTVTIQVQSPSSILITTSLIGGDRYYSLIDNKTAPLPILPLIQTILNGNPNGITWSSWLVNTSSGTLGISCGSFERDTALNGNPGAPGIAGNDGEDGGAYEDSTPLPVSWGDFAGTRNQNNVQLNWSTFAELNNDKFIVERKDAFSDLFIQIGTIKSSISRSDNKKYAFLDKNVPLGVLYYRLKQIDYDGKFEYSKTIIIDEEKYSNISVKAYPNPASDFISIDLSNAESNRNYTAEIYTLDGRRIKSFNNILLQNKFNINELKTGVYLLSVTQNNQVIYTKEIIIIR